MPNTFGESNPEKTASSASLKALGGTKVLEWAQLAAGPYCAKLLADLGAEVIKVEGPEIGDEARHRGPFLHNIPHPEKSLLFLYLNTNKLGAALDIENPADREKFVELVKWADIIIEDNPPQTLDRLKLTHEHLRRINPRLIMTSITPFGQTGPYHNYKAYPINTYTGGGLGFLSPQVEGGSAHPPVKMGGFFSEYACGLVGAVGTLAALYVQQVTGVGQQVDISKQEAILSLCRVQVDRYPNEGIIQSRSDSGRGFTTIFPCKDGYAVTITTQPHEWQALAKLIGSSEWVNDQRFQDRDFLLQHWNEINRRVSDWMINQSKEDIYHQGQALGCPITPIMTAKDIVDSEQTIARQFLLEIDHPVAGSLKHPGAPYHFSVTPSRIEQPAPLLGQHTEEIFSKLLNSNRQDVSVAQDTMRLFSTRDNKKRTPLQGVRVADFSWAWAGAHATELLAFLGAEVIKIESIKRIDFTRLLSFTTGQKFENVNESRVFNDINLGKLSIRLNLSQPQAVELAKKLVSISDIVMQNMRPGVMERLGLGYEALKIIKPDIIYLSSSARGATGPEKTYSGYAPNFAAWGGISYITGNPNGKPAFIAGEIDLLSAITSTFAILTALNYRLKTGKGQYIDLSSAEAMNALIGEILMDYTANGKIQTRNGNLDELMAPHNFYRCKGEDKWISIAVATDEEWQTFCKVFGSPSLAKEQCFSTANNRWQNQEELDKLIENWTVNYNHYEVMEMLQKAGIAAMPCFNAEELFNNPHLKHRQCWTKIIHPILGEQVMLAPPWKLSTTPANINSPAPLLGQHEDYVFKELLGMTDNDISLFEEQKIIY
ncbi:MAG: CoA transferase [Chloroflexi bacterium]|nr:CoA transferase [Chloroflexota bacterium]